MRPVSGLFGFTDSLIPPGRNSETMNQDESPVFRAMLDARVSIDQLEDALVAELRGIELLWHQEHEDVLHFNSAGIDRLSALIRAIDSSVED